MLVVFEDETKMVVDVWDTVFCETVEDNRMGTTHETHGETALIGVAVVVRREEGSVWSVL